MVGGAMDAFLVAGKHFDVIVVCFAVVKARVLCSKREGEVATMTREHRQYSDLQQLWGWHCPEFAVMVVQ
jgi:hypothetical protein